MKKAIIVFVLGITCSIASITWAETLTDITRKANQLLQEKDFQQAYEILHAEYTQERYDKQSLFLLGMSARELGKIDEAVTFFEELLVREEAPRVRLELAKTLYLSGNKDRSIYEFNRVKSTNPPRRVGEHIDRYIEAMKVGASKNWQLTATIGYMYDDNVNTGPDDPTILSRTPFGLLNKMGVFYPNLGMERN